MNGQVSEKAVLKMSSLSSGRSFTQEYERTGFRKSGIKDEQSVIRAVFYTGI